MGTVGAFGNSLSVSCEDAIETDPKGPAVRLTKTLALAALPLLAACAQDVPENVPLHGQWELTLTVDSVTVNGMMFAGSDLPPGLLLELEGTQNVCGEPLYIDRNWQARDIARRTRGQCELDDYSHDDSSARFGGTCRLETENVVYTPAISGTSRFGEATSRDVVKMRGSVSAQGASRTDILEIIAVQEGKRVGDC